MANIRGFVQRIDIGRAGLVVVTLLHEDGSTANYRIPDLDADPERFNERLSKLGVLRDAMTRAEPVEIEFTQDDAAGARLIERVVRITRDTLDLPTPVHSVEGLVVGVSVFGENRAGSNGEKPDIAEVSLIVADETSKRLYIDLQIPERGVAAAQLDIVREAQHLGRPLRFSFQPESGRITGVSTLASAGPFKDPLIADGFVEAISHVESAALSGDIGIAVVRFITAPAFGGAGNYVPLEVHAPLVLSLYVFKGSPDYALIEAGLRDGLRMRVAIARLGLRDDRGDSANRSVNRAPLDVDDDGDAGGGVLLGAELLAPLASASRPVWIKISRRTLDHGPDGFACTEGVPSSDLAPSGLRDLRLPYPAAWVGVGCFNHGVYRFQLALGVEFEILVDDEPLCIHDGKEGVKFAHACLGGEHEVHVKVQGWTCDHQFVMDVYRIR